MRAVQYRAPGELALVTVPDPKTQSDELLLRTEMVGICGSDLHFLHDGSPAVYPCKPGFSGHECVGIVEKPLSGGGPARGTRVLALAPDYDAFAELLVAKPATVISVPQRLDTERALLAQQLGTVLFCCRKLPNVVDRHVAVVGQGPAGLLFTMVLTAMGAATVTVCDVVQHRAACAEAFGATHSVHNAHEDPVSAVAAATNGKMADIVVEAVGKAATINLCASLVRDGGDVVIFGVPKTPVLPLRLERFMRKNARLVTSVFAQREPGLRSFRLAMAMIADGRLDPAPLITHQLPFGEAARGFALAQTKQERAIKVVLTF